MYAPNYISKVQLSTYLNVCIYDSKFNINSADYPVVETKGESTIYKIPANTIYQLREGQTLYISETLDEDKSSINDYLPIKYLPIGTDRVGEIKGEGKNWRKYEEGTIIKPSFDMFIVESGGIDE